MVSVNCQNKNHIHKEVVQKRRCAALRSFPCLWQSFSAHQKANVTHAACCRCFETCMRTCFCFVCIILPFLLPCTLRLDSSEKGPLISICCKRTNALLMFAADMNADYMLPRTESTKGSRACVFVSVCHVCALHWKCIYCSNTNNTCTRHNDSHRAIQQTAAAAVARAWFNIFSSYYTLF